LNLATGGASAFFFTDHATNTTNTDLIICGEQVGLNASNFFQNVDMDVVAQDVYFGGPGDSVTGLTVAPLGEQYFGLVNNVPGFTNDPAGLTVFDFGPLPGNSPEEGLLLFTGGSGATNDTQYLIFTP
jgi:hypothetical protein